MVPYCNNGNLKRIAVALKTAQAQPHNPFSNPFVPGVEGSGVNTDDLAALKKAILEHPDHGSLVNANGMEQEVNELRGSGDHENADAVAGMKSFMDEQKQRILGAKSREELAEILRGIEGGSVDEWLEEFNNLVPDAGMAKEVEDHMDEDEPLEDILASRDSDPGLTKMLDDGDDAEAARR